MSFYQRVKSAISFNHDTSRPIPKDPPLPAGMAEPSPYDIHALLKEEWDGHECRKFLIKHASVPRTLNYEDGRKVIYSLLQARFGDENLDLAIGVLEELIQAQPLFRSPASVYRRWKYEHRKEQGRIPPLYTSHFSATITDDTIEPLVRWPTRDRAVHSSPHFPTIPIMSWWPSNSAQQLQPWCPSSNTYTLPNSTIERSISRHTSTSGTDNSDLAIASIPRHQGEPWTSLKTSSTFGGQIKNSASHNEAANKLGQDALDSALLYSKKLNEKKAREDFNLKNPVTASEFDIEERIRYNTEDKNLGNETLRVPIRIHSPPLVALRELDKENGLPRTNTATSYLHASRRPATPNRPFDDYTNNRQQSIRPSADDHCEPLTSPGSLNGPIGNYKPAPSHKLIQSSSGQCTLQPIAEAVLDINTVGPSFQPTPLRPKRSLSASSWLSILTRNSSSRQEYNRRATLPIDFSKTKGLSVLVKQNPQVLDGNSQPLTLKTASHPPQGCLYKDAACQTSMINILDSHGLKNSMTLEDDQVVNVTKDMAPKDHQTDSRGSLKRGVALGKFPRPGSISQTRTQTNMISAVGRTVDGTFSPPTNVYNKQSTLHNTINLHNSSRSAPATFNSMDQGRRTRAPPQSPNRPKPLQVHKQSSQLHPARSQQHLTQNNTYQEHYEKPIYPPRTSSMRDRGQSSDIPQAHSTRREVPGFDDTVQSGLSSYRGHYLSDTSIEAPSTARSTVSSFKDNYLSDASPEIMGDFVPINPLDMPYRPATAEGSKVVFHASNNARKMTKVINPYEFEPSTPQSNMARQTNTSDFITIQDDTLVTSPRIMHTKSSHSEGNVDYMTRRPEPTVVYASKPITSSIHRSESSPTVSPLRFPPPRERSLTSELYSYDPDDDEPPSRVHRGRQRTDNRGHDDRQDEGAVMFSRSPTRQAAKGYGRESPSHASRQAHQEQLHSYVYARNITSSPTKGLEHVSEREELDGEDLSPPPSPPKKRSRSPMKKMFGDNGWLGQSPDEKPELKPRSKKTYGSRIEGSPTQKKSTMMGKLKTKLEEIAEKADISPMFKSENEKHAKMSVLSVSLGPPVQARIYMEVELMLVHTANNFLMNQFSQGRIAVDSIKKTVDTWKGKGRPVVIEFMYDQATQRDLVVVNQHNFRFHGERAASELRINSMLYNWKQVASLMAIRTFCNADTVILKLLFDIEQVLELLGAGEPMMLRLQQIRASANHDMRVARQNKDNKTAAPTNSRGQVFDWNARSSGGSASDGQSMEDSYGGMKLVPEYYTE